MAVAPSHRSGNSTGSGADMNHRINFDNIAYTLQSYITTYHNDELIMSCIPMFGMDQYEVFNVSGSGDRLGGPVARATELGSILSMLLIRFL